MKKMWRNMKKYEEFEEKYGGNLRKNKILFELYRVKIGFKLFFEGFY